MGGRTFFTRLIFGKAAATRMLAGRKRRILKLPDRRLLANTYLPAFAAEGGTILWVGCQAYTAEDYAVLERSGATVWTTDIDPEAACWGHATRHRMGDIGKADQLFADVTFDAIICNGVLGYGADSLEQQQAALAAMATLLRPGGRLLLGWNTDRIADPVAAGLTAKAFVPTAFAGYPERVGFDSVTHIYDSFLRS